MIKEKIDDKQFVSITDLQRSASKVLDTDKDIFIMKNNHLFKIITSVEDYNKQIDAFEKLNDKLLEAETYIRILEESKGNVKKLSDYEVRGDKANKVPVLDENDGWE
ncbi:hypothetical protein ACFHWD_12510 [Clostridium sp. MT-14]|jgi:PHD/YefM family antitoxin component YafN of YafNO toxin-antitoxin module|uniref:hypothetical protein n=1 Tax=Clostridium sp. MT-14 TaxID=3348360 RepID=UPI0035F2B731